jgi:hypothetical protein
MGEAYVAIASVNRRVVVREAGNDSPLSVDPVTARDELQQAPAVGLHLLARRLLLGDQTLDGRAQDETLMPVEGRRAHDEYAGQVSPVFVGERRSELRDAHVVKPSVHEGDDIAEGVNGGISVHAGPRLRRGRARPRPAEVDLLDARIEAGGETLIGPAVGFEEGTALDPGQRQAPTHQLVDERGAILPDGLGPVGSSL